MDGSSRSGSLDDATDRILSHLEDPRPTGPTEFNVRGLVNSFSRPQGDESNRLPLFNNPENGVTVVGIALVFPVSDSPATIEYVVGTVGPMPEEASQ